MESFNNRANKRSGDLQITAKISADEKQWKMAEVRDISSGGLKFLVQEPHNKGEIVFFDLDIKSMLANFRLKVKAEIRSDCGTEEDLHMYGVMFKGVSVNDQIRLDEIVQLQERVGVFGHMDTEEMKTPDYQAPGLMSKLFKH